MAKVALVNMPFGTAFGPSLGLSLLKAALEKQGISTTVFYPALWFADQSSNPFAVWEMIQCKPTIMDLAGEWIFSEACFGPNPEMDQEYVNGVLRGGLGHRHEPVAEDMIERILTLRSEATAFIDRCLDAVNWGEYQIVGFTSVFQQTMASIALARRIKQRYPNVLIAMGGANCEGQMGRELFNQFDCLDIVCSGEGDVAFPEAVSRYINGLPIGVIQGILHRGQEMEPIVSGELSDLPFHTQAISDLDDLPFPDFDDYFEQASRVKTHEGWPVYIYFETSRGCWWGAKNHCTFCGLNGQNMAFRSKTSDRALAELRYIRDRYEHHNATYQAVDNILDYKYMKDFLPQLKEIGLQGDLFYEVKANLTEAQVKALADSGIRNIQPGIESLSSPILKLMRKGISQLQNIQLLKLCRQYGVTAYWNLLFGFPGEPEGEYDRVAALMPDLVHLTPPQNTGPLRIDRFSPYFMAPEAHHLRNLRPFPSYRYVFRGLPESSLYHLAYYFRADYDGAERLHSYVRSAKEQARMWKEKHSDAVLQSITMAEYMFIHDDRPQHGERQFLFKGLERLILEATHQIASESSICRYVNENLDEALPEERILEALHTLQAKHLILRENDQYLSLVVPLVEAYLTPEEVQYTAELRDQLSRHLGLAEEALSTAGGMYPS